MLSILLLPTRSALHILTCGVYLCLSSVPVACCSHRGLENPRPHSIGSGSTTSTTLSQSSSSSGRGSLSPAGYPSPSQGAETNPSAWACPEGAEENELNGQHLYKPLLRPSCEHWKFHHRLSKLRTNSLWCRTCIKAGYPALCSHKFASYLLLPVCVAFSGRHRIVFPRLQRDQQLRPQLPVSHRRRGGR